jgi:hypothetical protein
MHYGRAIGSPLSIVRSCAIVLLESEVGMRNPLNLRDEIAVLMGDARHEGAALGREAAAEAALAATAVADEHERVNSVANALISAYKDRLNDRRLPGVVSQLNDRLILTAETSLDAMTQLSTQLRTTARTIGRLNPGFPLTVTPELELMDDVLGGLRGGFGRPSPID